MKLRYLATIGVVAFTLVALASVARADADKPANTLVSQVRQATAPFRDVRKAAEAGYGLFHGCANSPQSGSMGIHYANGALAGDGEIDPLKPEALLYEPRDGQLQLLGVEYLVLAADWHAKHEEGPPVLMGQLFNYVSAPNRYGLDPFYELHVWAWKSNPVGTFADFNPRVSCDSLTPGDVMGSMQH